MSIARDTANTIGGKLAAGTSLTLTIPGTTAAGDTVALAVAWNPNSTNGITASVPSGWVQKQTATRTVSGNETLKGALYVMENAAAQSGTVTITFSASVYAVAWFVPVSGAAVASFDLSASDNFSSLSADTGTTATTNQAHEYLLGLIANANSATTQSSPTNSFTQIDQQTNTGTGTDHINGAIYERSVTATGTYSTTVTLSGATSRSWIGIILTFKEATTSSTVQVAVGGGTGSGFRSWTGCSARTTSADVSSSPSPYGGTFLLRSCYKLWSAFEPNAPTDINTGTYDWTGLLTSLQAAADSSVTANPWKLIFRIEMGYAAPQWLFTTSVQPVTEWFFVDAAGNFTTGAGTNTSPGASTQNNHCPRIFDGSGVPDANLVAHTTRMLKEIQRQFSQPDGHGGKLGDHVYFMPIAMPSVQPGTEMTTQFGPATGLPNGFVYDGPSSYAQGATTYRQINTNQWNAIASSANRQTWLHDAWAKAIDLHMQYLTACPSALAGGSLFGDGWGGAQSLATAKGAQYGERLVFMTTDLQTDTTPYPTGTYAGWSTAADQYVKNVLAVGSPLGFQTAGDSVLSSEAKEKAAFDQALAYGAAFYETSPSQSSKYFPASTSGTGWLGFAAEQALLATDAGGAPGSITGQASVGATMSIIQQAALYALDTYNHTVTGGIGAADHGGSYTLSGTAGDFNETPGAATIKVTAANQSKEADLLSVLMDDTDQRLPWLLDTLPIGGNLTLRLVSRLVDANNQYHVGVYITPSGAFQLHARKVAGGVATQIGALATLTGTSFAINTAFWLRTSVTDSSPTTLQAKLWPVGTTEPDWQLSVTDSEAALQATGAVGVICRAETGVTSVPAIFTLDAPWQVFPQSPSVSITGQATVAATATGSNVPPGTGHKSTPRS